LIKDLSIKIYSDGADIEKMKYSYSTGYISGFTTNPSLMKQAGIQNYKQFVKEVIKEFPDVPVSFEVFSDDFDIMEKEAKKLSSFGNNVFVKIPIMNTKGESSVPLIKKLSDEGLNLNITAVFTVKQVNDAVSALNSESKSIISVFAGRIADTGIDPMNIMKESAEICHSKKGVELLWASSRELLNIFQAQEAGADIITVTPDLISKFNLIGKNLEEYSLDTVKGFYKDVQSLGYSILP